LSAQLNNLSHPAGEQFWSQTKSFRYNATPFEENILRDQQRYRVYREDEVADEELQELQADVQANLPDVVGFRALIEEADCPTDSLPPALAQFITQTHARAAEHL